MDNSSNKISYMIAKKGKLKRTKTKTKQGLEGAQENELMAIAIEII